MFEKYREFIARELLDVWKEAKSTTPEPWDDVTFERLPETHQSEYLKTADRIIAEGADMGWKSPEELKAMVAKFDAQDAPEIGIFEQGIKAGKKEVLGRLRTLDERNKPTET